jgi:hypothetical protein
VVAVGAVVAVVAVERLVIRRVLWQPFLAL